MERLENNDPKKYKYIKHRKQLSATKSFIRLHSTQEDLVDVKEVIKTREEQLKNEASNEAPKK